jgi:hypothetical protein
MRLSFQAFSSKPLAGAGSLSAGDSVLIWGLQNEAGGRVSDAASLN